MKRVMVTSFQKIWSKKGLAIHLVGYEPIVWYGDTVAVENKESDDVRCMKTTDSLLCLTTLANAAAGAFPRSLDAHPPLAIICR